MDADKTGKQISSHFFTKKIEDNFLSPSSELGIEGDASEARE